MCVPWRRVKSNFLSLGKAFYEGVMAAHESCAGATGTPRARDHCQLFPASVENDPGRRLGRRLSRHAYPVLVFSRRLEELHWAGPSSIIRGTHEPAWRTLRTAE